MRKSRKNKKNIPFASSKYFELKKHPALNSTNDILEVLNKCNSDAERLNCISQAKNLISAETDFWLKFISNAANGFTNPPICDVQNAEKTLKEWQELFTTLVKMEFEINNVD